jgi:hypothetical protein
MGDSHNSKRGSRPGGSLPPAQGPVVGQKPSAAGERPGGTSENSPESPDQFAGKSGRVIHDERGNAVWDWLKETSRIAIDSTSRLLKRLEVPELKVEDTQPNKELSIEADRDSGGGYNPYGGSTPGKGVASRGSSGGGHDPYGRSTSGKATDSRAGGSGSARTSGTPNTRGNSGAGNVGGGYDPYGKDVARKPTGRKP